MHIFHNRRTQNRHVAVELHAGEIIQPLESPTRVDMILDRIRTSGVGAVHDITLHGLDAIKAVHDAAYVDFIQTAWHDWHAAGRQGHVLPTGSPARRTRQDKIPQDIVGKLGYYALAADTAIDEGTFDAATASADIALSAMDHVLASGDPAFALCRPPGHHAASDQLGGYCLFNNAAITAQAARLKGVERVAIFDVDYHHGNGTQEIFYERDDVLFTSIHCDPDLEFPYYLGYADETGSKDGIGYTHNFPLAKGTTYAQWQQAFGKALEAIERFDPGLLIISLGVDTYIGDPLGTFTLSSDDFTDYGRRLAALQRPTVFLMEGGYAVEDIGVNVVNVLGGFDSGS